MRYSISFEIRNKVRALDVFGVEINNQILNIEVDDGFAKRVGVIFTGVPTSFAPTFTILDKSMIESAKEPVAHINSPLIPHKATGETLIRAWQAVLAPLIHIDINYEDSEESFHGEGSEKIDIPRFSSGYVAPVHGELDFGVYARAFYAAADCLDLIEPTRFFIEASIGLRQGFVVHAYNNFYLLIESIFANGKFKEDDVVAALMTNDIFMSAFKRALENRSHTGDSKRIFSESFGKDAEPSLREIVLLRGKLRHHSQKNAKRWSPNNQDEYRSECFFMLALCQQILVDRSAGEIFREDRVSLFTEQAIGKGVKMDIEVEVTEIVRGLPRVSFMPPLTWPHRTVTSELALRLLSKILLSIEASPRINHIVQIRAFDKRTGIEILRYALGGTVPIPVTD